MNDTSLADTTPTPTPAPGQGGGVFGTPTPDQPPAEPPKVRKHWTVESILEAAKLPEKYAHVCLRADLEAERQQILAELSTLVGPDGQLLDDPERSAGDTSAVARAQELADRDRVLADEMREHTVWVLFRGLSQEALADFNDQHLPKAGGDGVVNWRDYNVLLIAATAIDPVFTPDQVRALRSKLNSAAYSQLTDTAREVCTRGGVDVGKSPAFSVTRTQS